MAPLIMRSRIAASASASIALIAMLTVGISVPGQALTETNSEPSLDSVPTAEESENEDPLVGGDYEEEIDWESYSDQTFNADTGTDQPPGGVSGGTPNLSIEAHGGTPSATKLVTWRDGRGVTQFLRQGTWDTRSSKGFGWAKIKARHGITKHQTVKHPTGNPRPKFKGAKVEYVAYAQKVVNRRVVAQIPVITVIDNAYYKSYYTSKINGSPGVLTTYCVNPDRALKCPSWVDVAFSKSNNPRAYSASSPGVTADAMTTDYFWTYDPIS